jgi:hypothetical protein
VFVGSTKDALLTVTVDQDAPGVKLSGRISQLTRDCLPIWDPAAFTATCDLAFHSSAGLDVIDSMDVRLGVTGGTDRQTVSFAGVYEAPTSGGLSVLCGAGPVDFEDLDIVATEVETAEFQ